MAPPERKRNLDSQESLKSMPGYDASLQFCALVFAELGFGDRDPLAVVVEGNPNLQTLLEFSDALSKEVNPEDGPVELADLNNIQKISVDPETEELVIEYAVSDINIRIAKGEKLYEALFWLPSADVVQASDAVRSDLGDDLAGDLTGERKERLIDGFRRQVEMDELTLDTAREVVDGLNEGDLDNLQDPARIQNLLAFLKDEVSKIEGLKDDEKEEFVTNNRQKLTELKFLTWYVANNSLVEEVDGREIWRIGEDEQLDMTSIEEDIVSIEQSLTEVVVKNEETGEEESVYENLDIMRDTISVKDFLQLPIEKRLALVSNIKSQDLLKPDTLLVFDFGANSKLERHIGLGDLMPPWVRAMSLGGGIFSRKGNQGFYEKGRYLAIFSGTEVQVREINESYSPKEEYNSKYKVAYADSDIVKSGGGVEARVQNTEVTYGEVAEIGENFLVDSFFLQAVLEIKQFDSDTATGGNYDFMHMAARYIQNAEAKYEQLYGSAMHENGQCYSEKFIAYAMDRFSLFNDFSPEQELVVHDVVRRYAELRGVDLQLEKVSQSRVQMNPRENKSFRREVQRRGFSSGVEFEMPHGGKGIEMLSDEASWEAGLRESLRLKGVPERQIELTVHYSRSVYGNMQSRMGSMYNSMVTLTNYEGKNWTIKNSCVGGSMSFSQGLPLRVMRGLQAGRKYASDYYWGGYKKEERVLPGGFHYIRSLVQDDSMLIKEDVNPGNVDEVVGRHLAVGEPAVAGLWNHAIWLYKRPDGTVMIVHSGADVRPRTIPVSSVSEAPAGYVQRGDKYVRQRGSKVNELPFRDFLARKQDTYGGSRGFVKLVTMSSIVESNLNYALGSGEFIGHYERNKG